MGAGRSGIGAKLGNVDPLAAIWQRGKPLPHPQKHLMRAPIVLALDLIVGEAHLQDGTVQLAYRAVFVIPGFL